MKSYRIDQAGALFKSADASEQRYKQHQNPDDDHQGRWREEVVFQEEGNIVVDGVDGRTHGYYQG